MVFDLATQYVLPTWTLITLLVWEMLWTGLAMWKTARRGHVFWFLVFFLVNLAGIPEIFYLIMTRKKKSSKGTVKKASKAKKKKRR